MNRNEVMVIVVGLCLTATMSFAQQGSDSQTERQAARKEFKEQLKKENDAFKETIKDLSPEERKEARRIHRTELQAKNQVFKEKNLQERISFIESNDKLSAEQKAERIQKVKDRQAKMQLRYEEKKAERENVQVDINKNEKRIEVKEHRVLQNMDRKELREQFKEEKIMRQNGLGKK